MYFIMIRLAPAGNSCQNPVSFAKLLHFQVQRFNLKNKENQSYPGIGFLLFLRYTARYPAAMVPDIGP